MVDDLSSGGEVVAADRGACGRTGVGQTGGSIAGGAVLGAAGFSKVELCGCDPFVAGVSIADFSGKSGKTSGKTFGGARFVAFSAPENIGAGSMFASALRVAGSSCLAGIMELGELRELRLGDTECEPAWAEADDRVTIADFAGRFAPAWKALPGTSVGEGRRSFFLLSLNP